PVGRLDLVVEVVVAVLVDRRGLRRALLPAAAIDVEVGEDSKEPRAEVRARSERAPAAKGARVRLLHQVLRLLARPDEMPGDPEALVRQLERLFFETNAVTRLLRNPPGVCLRGLAHAGHVTKRLFSVERG